MPESSGFALRDVVRYAPIAIVGGGLIGFIIGGGRWNPRAIAHGALIGTICFAFAIALDVLFRRWLAKDPDAWWRRALIYFIAGQIGWPIGLFLGLPLIWGVPIFALHISRKM